MNHSTSVQVPVLVVTALVVAVTTGYIFWTNKYKNHRDENDSNDQKGVSSSSSVFHFDGDTRLEYDFDVAIKTMKNREITSKMKLTTTDQLMFYGLYKQAILGNAPNTMPISSKSWNVMQQKAKYDAWIHMKDMTKKEAAIRYVTAVEHFTSPFDAWEKVDDDDSDNDDDGGNHENGMGPIPFSRPIVVPIENDDHYDDAVNLDGSASIESRLFKAASENNVSEIHQLFRESQPMLNVNHTDPTGQTALHIAVDKCCMDVVKILIETYHANVNAIDHDGISVLQTCVVAGHVTLCEWLYKVAGANPDVPDMDGDTPRSCAQNDPSMKHLFI